MLKSVDDVIEALGGPTKAAGMIGVGASAVSNWRTRGEIPPEHFLVIGEALNAIGVCVDSAVFGFNEVRA